MFKVLLFVSITLNLNSQSTTTFKTDFSRDELKCNILGEIHKITVNSDAILNSEKSDILFKILQETNKRIIKLKENNINNFFSPEESAIYLRKAILDYFFKTNKYPVNLNELIPEFIPYIPEINIHGEKNNRIKYIKSRKYDRNYRDAIDNKTEYIYFSDPDSRYWGLLILNKGDNHEDNKKDNK